VPRESIVVELATMTIDRRGRLRRWLGGDGPPSLRAALFLALSTFLCGCVVASLLFVGVWRHTAGEAARLQAAQAHARAIQQADRQQLLAAKADLDLLKARFARNERLLTEAKRRAAQATTALARARAATRAISRTLTPRLQTVADAAAALARQTATIHSELTALETYAQQPGATGIDAGYLETQARYVARQAAAAASAAAALTQQARDAQASAGSG
jgi:hypothetical protein